MSEDKSPQEAGKPDPVTDVEPETQAKPETDTPAQQKPQKKTGEKFDFNTLVYQLWNGALPLVQVFWLYYFTVVIILAALGSILTPMASLFHLIKLVWAGFMVKPIWVAADDYKGPDYWAWLAKAAAVLIAIGVALQFLGF